MVHAMQVGDISVDVVFKDIKNVHLSVHPPTGRVTISAPARMSLENVRLFAITKLGWIRRQQKRFGEQERETPREYLERESHYVWGTRYLLRIEQTVRERGARTEHRNLVLRAPRGAPAEERAEILEEWYRTQLRKGLKPLIEKWERRLDVSVSRVFIQRMKTKWGSSSPQRRTIRLNLELAKKPPECLDYVVLHEMAHFLAPNHGEAFVALLDRHMPQWRMVRQKLNDAQLTTADWPGHVNESRCSLIRLLR